METMFKWFKPGLSREELKKEYRRLAKEYHPDINKTNGSDAIMKEINDEYDNYTYFSDGSSRLGSLWDSMEKGKDSTTLPPKRRRILMWLIRDRQLEQGGDYLAPGEKAFFGYPYLSTNITYGGHGDEWRDKKSGLHFVEVGEFDILEYRNFKVTPVEGKSIITPSDAEIVRWIYANLIHDRFCTSAINSAWSSRIHIINSKIYGRICYVSEKFRSSVDPVMVLATVDGKIYEASAKLKWFGDYEVEREEDAYDFYVRYYLKTIGVEELFSQFDINYRPKFADSFKLEQIGRDFLPRTDDPVVAQWFRKGIITIYRTKSNYQMIYGTINVRELMNALPEITLDDLDEVQDYLDEINEAFDASVKSMIKRGKLHIIV